MRHEDEERRQTLIGVNKETVDDLSIFGGMPAFEDMLHVGRPNVGDRKRFGQRLTDIFERRWFTNYGPYVQEFEQRVADMHGVKHCVAMCNGTVAMEIAIRALGLTGEVIVPSFTFVATAHALQWQEITPVFCDINPETHNIDPTQLEKLITPKTTGMIGVHLWGRPCDVEGLVKIAEGRKLKILFDAAHAFGCSYKGRMIGNFGNAEVLSFHATKFVNTFEGGAVVTNDDELAQQMRLMKNFGFAGYDNVIYVGTNGKMSEVCAAMGLTNLESMDDFIAINYDNYKQYYEELADIPGIQMLEYNEEEKSNYQYIVLEIDEAVTQVSRDQFVEILHAENIIARRYFYPGCHQMEFYRSHFPHPGVLLHDTDRVSRGVLSLPTGSTIKSEDVGEICEIIRLVVSNGVEIGRRLQGLGDGDRC